MGADSGECELWPTTEAKIPSQCHIPPTTQAIRPQNGRGS